MNWGWGRYDGWFPLTALNPTSGHYYSYHVYRPDIICNIYPVRDALDPDAGKSGQLGNIFWKISGNVITFSGTGDMPDLVNYQQPWYPYREIIMKAVIEDGITSIGNNAFYFCENIKTIEIPNSVTRIGRYAFDQCGSLTNIKIPSNVTSIEDGTFNGCASLAGIDIPNGITSIGASAFYNCHGLTTIKIPNSVTSIRGGTFNGCINLTSVELPDGITSIEGYTFQNCESLTNIKIPDGVTNIGYQAFCACKNLESIEIPNSVTIIGESALAYCYKLTDINLPNSLTNIGKSAFVYCYELTDINLPNSLTSIGISAFNQTNLTSISIPDNVTNIGDYAFSFQKVLKYVDVYWEEPLPISSYPFHGSNLSNTILIVPEGTKTRYEAANGWKNFGTIIERPVVESVSVYASLITGNSLRLKTTTSPSNALYTDVTWSSGDETIATVDATGKVTAVSPGMTTITATATIGGKTASFDVQVEEDTNTYSRAIALSGETSNDPVNENNRYVSLENGMLTVNTPDKETVRVYSMIGTLLFSAEKSEGKQIYSIPNLSKEIYIVTGSNGWNTKLRNN